jgi:Flp pilus assembly pilin Flp
MTGQLTSIARRAGVGVRLAATDVGARVVEAADRRVAPLRDHAERGAQAAEYAMLGGVSAAACSGLVAILKNSVKRRCKGLRCVLAISRHRSCHVSPTPRRLVCPPVPDDR